MILQLGGLVMRVGAVLLSVQLYPLLLSEVYAISGFVFYAVYLVVIYYAVLSSTKARSL